METNKNVWIGVDAWINRYLDANPSNFYLLDLETMTDIIEYSHHALDIVNIIGLKRKIGNILKSRGFTKSSSSPPHWNLKLAPSSIKIPDSALDCYRSFHMIERAVQIARDELIKAYPDIDVEARL